MQGNPTYAPTDHGHPEYALAGHGHGAIVIALTPINGFLPYAASPGFRNELRLWPSLGLACLRFGVENPQPATADFLSWDEAYSVGIDNFMIAPSRISQGGIWNPQDQFTYLGENRLIWATNNPAPAPIDFLVGTAWFPYA